MEVNKSEAPAVVSRDGKQLSERNHGDDEDAGHDDGQDNENSHPFSRPEAFQVDGALDGVIPPRIQQMLSDLAAQLEPLRRDLEISNARERDLRDKLERHPYLPVLNRQGLEHELSRVVGHIQGLGRAAFVCVSVTNAERIRMTYGRSAYEQAMSHACKIVEDSIDGTDIVGCLGGHDLGVLLLAPGDDAIDGFHKKLTRVSQTDLFATGRSSLPLEIGVGGILLQSGHNFHQALSAADSDMLSRLAV